MNPEHVPRLLEEVKRLGGESALNGYSDEDRALLDRQSIVLSFLREHGDATKAAFDAGEYPTTVMEWDEGDTLGFKRRREQALEEVGQSIMGTLVERLRDPEWKTAVGLWDRAFRYYLPGVFNKTDTSDTSASREVMDYLRSQGQAPKPDSEVSADGEGDSADESTIIPISDLLRRRKNA